MPQRHRPDRPDSVLLVEEGDSRIALSTARSLHAHGWRIGVAAPRRGAATQSRCTSAFHPVPQPGDDVGAFVAGVCDAVRGGGYDVVLPMGDPELLALSAMRAELGALLPYPEHEVVVRAVDKAGLSEAAAAAGLVTPRVFEAAELQGAPGPFLVKDRLHGRVGRVGTAKLAAVRVSTAQEARAAAEAMAAAGGLPLVQSAVEGPLAALVLVCDKRGELAAVVQQRSERIWPTGAGNSAFARTVPVDRSLVDAAAGLLRELRWWGLVQLQFVEQPDGPPVLIDFNARCYGSIALASAAGVDLAHIWLQIALGRPTGARVEARPGLRYQRFGHDLRRAWNERDGGVLRDVARVMAAAPRSSHSTLSRSDPRPALVGAATIARRGLSRVRPQRSSH